MTSAFSLLSNWLRNFAMPLMWVLLVPLFPSTVFAQDEPAAPPDAKKESESSGEVLAGHSYHGEAYNEGPRQAAYLMEGTGAVDFPVQANNPAVQQFINQGVGQLHGFWYFEAERSFRQVAAIQPDCAAAYWGMAMANANNRDRAKKFIAEAEKHAEKASPRVKRYIEALSELLKSDKAKGASEKYIKALERIVYDYPDDIEAKAFIALHMWEGRRNGLKITSHLAVDALIQQVLAVQPMHPVHHYRIHLWDYEKPERALEAAALCGQSAPSIAHMWHMPGHIFSRLKRYPEAVWQQEASARTDHAQMIRDRLLPDQIHNFAHNNEWLIRNLIYVGRVNDALDLAKNMIELPRHPKYNTLKKRNSSSYYGRLRLMQVLSAAELWPRTIALSQSPYLEPTEDLTERVKRIRAVGRAYFRMGQSNNGQSQLEELQRLLSEIEEKQEAAAREAEEQAKKDGKNVDATKKAVEKARKKLDGDKSKIQRAMDEMNGYLAVQKGEYEKALALFNKAREVDKMYLASIHVLAGKTNEAIEMARKHVDGHANETIPLANQIALLWQVERRDTARTTFEKLRKISAFIDMSYPPFARLAPVAAELGWPQDWRLAHELADDIGDRPNLDDLGPFRWQPHLAKDWTLPSAHGKPISLSEYQGKPLVLIFFLGYGCLHCAEQLQAFGPHSAEFSEAGLSLLAISSDDQQGLQQSVENYGNDGFPFPLVADHELKVFRRYRVFDDFEDQPLHGTFLIDAQGYVRWHDISYEPFMDYQFVLKEARRLLAQSVESIHFAATDR